MAGTDRDVRVHTHVSNRAKRRENVERKAVFKSVLGNPFRVQWPSMPANVQNSFLAKLSFIFDGVSESFGSRARKRTRPDTISERGTQRKRRKVGNETGKDGAERDGERGDSTENAVCIADAVETDPPSDAKQSCRGNHPVWRHCTFGINEVTKRLERQVKNSRLTVTLPGISKDAPHDVRPPIRLIFVCRADIDPPLLIAHLPYLVASFNASVLSSTSAEKPDFIKLVPLPEGAEFTLAGLMGIRRLAVVAIDSNAPQLSSFDPLLDSVPTLAASWLAPPDVPGRLVNKLIPTHVKQLCTSAPKNMKAVKAKRAEEKRQARQNTKTKKVLKRARAEGSI